MGTQESPPLAVGTRLDAYEVAEVVEQGRYSHTYLARDAAGIEVLIQEFLPHEFAVRDGGTVRAREAEDKTPLRFWLRSFLDKAVLLQKLNHPGLIRVLGQFEANGTGYYVTERVAGQSLEAILQRDNTLSEAQLRRLLAPVLSGLEQAHAVGLLHRDIRPQNILLRADDSAVLTSFGVLRAPIRFKARTVFSAGAPPYAAPEEFFMAGPHGPWTDLYALGATAYRVVTGQAPADARSRATGPTLAPVAMTAKVRLSETMAAAIDEALHLTAEQRPQSIAAWRATLQGAAGQEAETAEADMPAAEYGAVRKRSPLPMVLGAVVVLGGAAAAWFVLNPRGGQDAATAPPAATAQPAAAPAQQAAAAPGAAAPAAATAPPPDQSANGGDLDRLAMDLMSKEKKLADARDQLQAQHEQALQTAAASKPAPTQAAAATQAPSSAEAEAADRLRQLQAEVERLRKEKEPQAAAPTTIASAAPATRSGPDWPTWYRDATGSVRQNLRYPQKSLQAGEEGDLTVKVHMRRDGSIIRTDLAQRSPYSALNQEAVEVFSRIGRFAPLPADYQPNNAEVDLNMPINFKLSD